MESLIALHTIATIYTVPLLTGVAWLVWRIYNNHLPHIEERLDGINERLSRLEGQENARLARRR